MKIKSSIPYQFSSWMTTSRHPIYLYTRIEVRRNLADQPLPDAAKPNQKERILQDIFWTLDDIMQQQGSSPHLYLLPELSPTELHLLKKKGLISLAEVKAWEALILDASEEIALEVNRGDHITLRVTLPGFLVPEAVKTALLLEAMIAKRIPFAYHKRFGFLTSSLTEVGTGMRIILCGTFPGIVMADRSEEFFQLFRDSKVLLRKVEQYAQGYLFLMFNRTPLGLTEEEIEEIIYTAGKEAEEKEFASRKDLYQKEQVRFEDRVWRAYGLLKYARWLSFREALYNISLIRLGYRALPYWEKEIRPEVSAELFFGSDTETLALLTGQEPQENEALQKIRSDWVRQRLHPLTMEKET